MKAFKVDYQLEQYIPEYQAYLRTQTFTEQEVSKITQQREKFERLITESFAPLLSSFTDYIQHLQATSKLAQQRYRSNNEGELPQEFYLPMMNITRIARMQMSAHSNNYKSFMFLLNYCKTHNNEKLMDSVTEFFVNRHSHFATAWLMRCKFVEGQSINDARRLYNKSYLFIKEFKPNQDVVHITHMLNKEEELNQKLPQAVVPIALNWLVMELGYLKQLTKGISTDQITDPEIKKLIDGCFVKLNFYKFVKCVLKFDVIGVPTAEQQQKIVTKNKFIVELQDELIKIQQQMELQFSLQNWYMESIQKVLDENKQVGEGAFWSVSEEEIKLQQAGEQNNEDWEQLLGDD